MLSKFSHGLKQRPPFPISSGSSSATSITASTASTANRGHHPTTSNSSFTPPSLTENTSNHSVGERKEEREEKGHVLVVDRNALPSLFVQPELLPRAYWTQKGMIKRRGHLEQHWVVIYAFLDLSFVDRLKMRSYCRLFHEVEKILTVNKHGHEMLTPLPLSLWTAFPHLKYPTLNRFVDKLNRVFQKDPTKAPKIVFVMEGTFHNHDGLVHINYPLMMIGAGRNKTFLHGYGLCIRGTKEEGKEVVVQDMTISSDPYSGLDASDGLFFLCKRMTFTQCEGVGGVVASNTKGRLINCVITQCVRSGIYCGPKALIDLEGSQTKVDGNGTNGQNKSFGLNTYGTSSRIHLLFPLTKESVSTNNRGGRNYYGCGTVETVDTFESL